MAIIGISGKIGSGKDTVGKIIQFLTHCKNDNTTYAEWQTLKSTNMCDWQIKKYADKLKDIVCLLIGCTREQLEDADFKNKELGEEWWYYQLQRQVGYGSVMIPYLGNEKEIPRLTLHKLTPRLLLQLLGTECGRDIIHPNVWINALFSKYNPRWLALDIMDMSDNSVKRIHETPESNWIITDVRFPNELKAVKDRGGITIRVNRIHNEKLLHDITIASAPFGVGSRMIEQNKSYNHPSETALDNAEFDYIIDNNGTILELIQKVREILIKHNII